MRGQGRRTAAPRPVFVCSVEVVYCCLCELTTMTLPYQYTPPLAALPHHYTTHPSRRSPPLHTFSRPLLPPLYSPLSPAPSLLSPLPFLPQYRPSSSPHPVTPLVNCLSSCPFPSQAFCPFPARVCYFHPPPLPLLFLIQFLVYLALKPMYFKLDMRSTFTPCITLKPICKFPILSLFCILSTC